MEFGGEQRRHPEAHELAEDVAEGQGVQEAEGVDPALVLADTSAISCRWARRLARTLPWVWTMPLGSDVVPEVKMIWKGRLFGDGFAYGEVRFGG